MRAVVLIVRFADLALQACPNLCADANTISDLDGCHLVANLDGMPDDLVADAQRKTCFAPSTGDGMDVTTADTTCFNSDVDVTLPKWFWFVLHAVSELPPLRNGDWVISTSFFLKSLQFFCDSIMKPSKVSG